MSEQRNKKSLEYYYKNRDFILYKNRCNTEEKKKYNRKYYLNNKGKLKEQHKEYFNKNKDNIMAYQNEYYRIKRNCGTKKYISTKDNIDKSIGEKEHLEFKKRFENKTGEDLIKAFTLY